MVLDPLPG